MSVVLDSSATLAFVFQDEKSPVAARVFERVAAGRGHVPSLWRLEVANGLQAALRRGRITAAFRDAALEDLGALDIAVDRETDAHAWAATLALADRFRLTLYDAAYLELAARLGLPLGSLDRALVAAAGEAGVAVVA